MPHTRSRRRRSRPGLPRWLTARRLLAALGLVLLLAAAGFYLSRTGFDEYVERADWYAAEGRFAEAIIEYRNAIELEPRAGEVRARLADAYVQVSDLPAAVREVVSAANLLSGNAEVQRQAAATLLAARSFDEARVSAERALQLEPGDLTGQILHATALAGLRQFDAAMAGMQKAIELDPTRAVGYADLAALQLATGEVEQSEANLRRAAEVAPDDPDTHLALASLLWSQGRQEEAEAAFKAAVTLAPRNVGANRALATFYLGNGRPREAEAHLQALADVLGTVQAKLVLADYYLTEGRLAEGTRLLEELATMPGGRGDAQSRLASLAYAAGRTAEAHRLLDDTLDALPSHPRALLTKANFLVLERNVDDAISFARMATLADPRSADAHYTLAALLASIDAHDEAVREFNEVLRYRPYSVSAKIHLARLNLVTGRPEVASQLAREAIKGRPDDLAPRVILVRTLIGQGDLDAAERELTDLLSRMPDVAALHWLQGVVLSLRQQPSRARPWLQRAMALDPDAFEPLEALVALDMAAGVAVSAKPAVETRLQGQPDDPDLLMLAARIYAAEGAGERAEAMLTRAIALDADAAAPYQMLGQLYLRGGRLDQARVQFETLASRSATLVSAATMVGMIRQVQGDMPGAEAWYRRALEADRDAVVAANNLAWILADRGDSLDEALQLSRDAAARAPDDADVNDTLGWVYLRRGLPDLAIRPIRTAVEKVPTNPVYRYHLGLAYAKAGDTERARASLTEALELGTDFPEADAARQLLDSLR
ncbi:MAG: tetratricopeptide repeat protein [Acidimicrobiia bacterium]|nr:tetratricopeptide repeat protein [Acidimicrobiia bacterium]